MFQKLNFDFTAANDQDFIKNKLKKINDTNSICFLTHIITLLI